MWPFSVCGAEDKHVENKSSIGYNLIVAILEQTRSRGYGNFYRIFGKEMRIAMNTVRILNFGPIHEASIDLEMNLQVLIGTQASGKSTICKVVYFCQRIRDYTLDFLMDARQFTDNHQNE